MQTAVEHPPPAFRTTAAPAVKVAPKGELRFLGHLAPRPGRKLGLALLTVALLAVAGFLSWRALVQPITVVVAPLQSDVRVQVFGLGTVGARVQSNVGFKVAGVLAALSADQGDLVKAGRVLARLEASDVEAQLALASAGVAQARANVAKADPRSPAASS